MRTKIILILFGLLTAISLFNSACKDEDKYKKEITQLDSMKIELKDVKDKIQNTDTLVSLKRADQIKNDLSQIDTLLPDTISDKELAILLMEYRSLITPLKLCPLKMRDLRKEAIETEKRITDLNNDLVKDIADEKQVKAFVESEKNNTNAILNSFSVLNTLRDSIIKKTDTEKEVIKGKIQELEIIKKDKKKHK